MGSSETRWNQSHLESRKESMDHKAAIINQPIETKVVIWKSQWNQSYLESRKESMECQAKWINNLDSISIKSSLGKTKGSWNFQSFHDSKQLSYSQDIKLV